MVFFKCNNIQHWQVPNTTNTLWTLCHWPLNLDPSPSPILPLCTFCQNNVLEFSITTWFILKFLILLMRERERESIIILVQKYVYITWKVKNLKITTNHMWNELKHNIRNLESLYTNGITYLTMSNVSCQTGQCSSPGGVTHPQQNGMATLNCLLNIESYQQVKYVWYSSQKQTYLSYMKKDTIESFLSVGVNVGGYW